MVRISASCSSLVGRECAQQCVVVAKVTFFKRAVLLPCNSSREYSLAQDHFSANQFEPILLRKFGTKKLKRDATPTIFSQQHLRTPGKPTTLGIAQCLFSWGKGKDASHLEEKKKPRRWGLLRFTFTWVASYLFPQREATSSTTRFIKFINSLFKHHA